MARVLLSRVNAMNNRHDDRRRPAEHDDPISRLEGGEQTPFFFKNNLAIPQRGKGDHRETKGFLDSF